jgi:hypothetical protein
MFNHTNGGIARPKIGLPAFPHRSGGVSDPALQFPLGKFRASSYRSDKIREAVASNCNFVEIMGDWCPQGSLPMGGDLRAIHYEDITSNNLFLFCHRHFAADYFGSGK